MGSMLWEALGEKPTWKPSRMHRYQGGTSSILYNMSNLGSVGRDTGGSFVEVPAKPVSSYWGQQRTVTQGGEVNTGKVNSAPESIRCLSSLSAPQNGVRDWSPHLPQCSSTQLSLGLSIPGWHLTLFCVG